MLKDFYLVHLVSAMQGYLLSAIVRLLWTERCYHGQ